MTYQLTFFCMKMLPEISMIPGRIVSFFFAAFLVGIFITFYLKWIFTNPCD